MLIYDFAETRGQIMLSRAAKQQGRFALLAMKKTVDAASVTIGFPEEWRRFSKKHPHFIAEFVRINRTFQRVFGREAATTSVRDRIIFFMGSLCVEEFKEIFLLCGNGYGVAGAKLLRGLYERAVDLAYLVIDPVAFTDYINFHHVQRFREMNHLTSVKGVRSSLAQAEVDLIKERYERVRTHFEEILCEKCDIHRTMASWTKLSLVARAHRAGPAYERLYLSCYFQPTMQSHSTMQAFGVRLVDRRDGGTDFSGAAQRRLASRVMGFANTLVLLVLLSQDQHFKLGLQATIREHLATLKKIWWKTLYPRQRTSTSL